MDFNALGRHFGINGDFTGATPFGNGHINDTVVATYSEAGVPRRYLHQRINRHIFTDPDGLMDNIARVTRHVRQVLESRDIADAFRRVLTILPTISGDHCLHTDDGETWRTYDFIEGTTSHERIETPEQARLTARAFGEFQGLLSGLPGPRLHETIKKFHHTRSRFEAFVQAKALEGRAEAARDEIAFARRREPLVDALLDLNLPERITHNDTKLNNVLFDIATGEALCVVDLDTVMPGLGLYDFGDMVRSATSPALEDETDLSKVTMQMPMFAALAQGYVEATRSFLQPGEKSQLAFSGKLITLETGLRFLTDFLQGDVYFKTHRPGHNLDRCRTQFKLVESIEAQENDMRRFVDSL